MRSVLRIGKRGKKKVKGDVSIPTRSEMRNMEFDSKIELIQSLIPIGLMAVSEELESEVMSLTGEKHNRTMRQPGHVRYGTNPGTVNLGGQKIPVYVPRVRNTQINSEVPIKSYQRFHKQRAEVNELLLRRVLFGLSCRNYESAAESIPGTLGLSSSTVSRQFIKASSTKLREFQERDLSEYDIVSIFIDGKKFAQDQMVLVIGVTLGGEKVLLGFIQTSTENEMSVSELLRDILSRGLRIDQGILAVIDGSKGLQASIRKVFRHKALIQRCQWHKRENVVSYLPKSQQPFMRKRLQRAYNKPTYTEAKAALMIIRKELSLNNQSAMKSLEEGFEETLTLHRLGVFPLVGESFKTTNCIESINSIIEKRCGKVTSWKNSNQKQRWFGTALLDIEPRLNRVRGYCQLPKLRDAIKIELHIQGKEKDKKEVA